MRATKKQISTSLPGDVEALKKIIADQGRIIARNESVIVKKDSVISSKEQCIALLEEFVRLHKLKKFTASTEKSLNQQEMFNEAELSVAAEAVLTEQESERDATSHDVPVKPKQKAESRQKTLAR